MKSTLLFLLLTILAGAARAQLCLGVKEGVFRGCARDLQSDKKCSQGALAWDANSCIISSAADFIPEIVDAPYGQSIPAKIYSQYSAQQIAENIVYRVYKEISDLSSDEDIRNPEFDYYHQTDILMAIHATDLSSILQSGFLNQFQIHKSAGIYNPSYRQTAEDYIVHLNLNGESLNEKQANIANFVRPKYAYLTTRIKTKLLNNPWVSNQYGNVFVRFKDRVKKRSTFTNCDSLDARWGTCSALYTPTTFFDMTGRTMKASNNYETQIWGPLAKDDIDSILVGCFNGIDSNADQVIQSLKEAHLQIPVYSCDSLMEDGTFLTMKPKELLYPIASSPAHNRLSRENLSGNH